MSRHLRNAIIASMESDDVELLNPLTGAENTNIDEVLLDVSEKGEDVQQAEEVVEVLEGAEESMEALAASLEACIADGGMSPQTARTHNIAMANALRGLPLDVERVTVSSESFGGHGDKLSASQESLAGVKETLKKLWDGIVNAIKNAFAAVKTFVMSIGKSASAVRTAGAALKKKAAENKGVGDFTVSESVIKSLGNSQGQFNPKSALLEVVTGYKVLVVGYTNKATSAMSPMLSLLQGGKFTPEELKEAASQMDVEKLASEWKGNLPGGYKYEAVRGTGDDALAALASSKVSFTKADEVPVPSGEVKVSHADVVAIADGVIAIGGIMTDYPKTYGQVEKGVQNLIAAGTKAAAKADGLSKEELAATKSLMAKVSKCTFLLRGIGPQYMKYAGGIAKAGVSLGNAVLNGKMKIEK